MEDEAKANLTSFWSVVDTAGHQVPYKKSFSCSPLDIDSPHKRTWLSTLRRPVTPSIGIILGTKVMQMNTQENLYLSE